MPRLFLGIPVPATEGLVAAAESLAEVELASSGMRLVSVPSEQWHLTWAFLGFVPDEQMEALVASVAGCVAGFSDSGLDATLRAAGAGCFGGPVWAGIEFRDTAARALLDEARSVAVGDFGFSESRAWKPHLTLGRAKNVVGSTSKFVRPGALKSALKDWLADNSGLCEAWVEVPELVLFESQLTPHGAVHTALERWRLN